MAEWIRSRYMAGMTRECKLANNTLFITINYDSYHVIREVFILHGKVGSDTYAATVALAIMISENLQEHMDIEITLSNLDKIIKRLKNIQGQTPVIHEGVVYLSMPDAVAKILEEVEAELSQRRHSSDATQKSVIPQTATQSDTSDAKEVIGTVS